jgi:siroheme synthase
MAAQQAWLTQGIYMGVSGAATIQQEIMKGLHADTSVAVIEKRHPAPPAPGGVHPG